MRVLKMKRLIFLLFFAQNDATAQLVVKDIYTPQQLVQNFLAGPGITISNIIYTGSDSAIGFFDGTSTNLGLDSGIIIASGNIKNAIGPNQFEYKSSAFFLPGDVDLDLTTGQTTFDAAVLEFDFVSDFGSVEFNYVFASEEFLEFVNSGVNDAFGFFISGPYINGAYSNSSENLAIIPGNNTTVSIDNVNLDSNPEYYTDNASGTTIEYDGFTKKLTATADVMCGVTYHIKIVIADAGDDIYDSGVFLQASSLHSSDILKRIDVYNIFTPNGDNKNDVFKLRGLGFCNTTYTMEILNRWGQKIYSGTYPGDNFWDGNTASGEKADDGVYYYILTSSASDNSSTGFVTLIR